MTDLDKVAKAIYEADVESGYNADDPRTFYMAEDSCWSPVVWEYWRNIARAAMAAMPQNFS